MEVTPNQELYIEQYIGEIEAKIGEQLSPAQRERALSRLRARIDEKLKFLNASSVEDAELLGILHKMGPPETQAQILVRVWGDPPGAGAALPAVPAETPLKEAPEGAAPEKEGTLAPKSTAKVKGPVWLGVGLYVSGRSGLPAWTVRFLAVLLGLVTGPVALVGYMALFVMLRIRGRIHAPAPFHLYRIPLYPVLTGGMLTLVYLAGLYGIKGIYTAHQHFLGRPVPELNEWAWLEVEAPYLFLGALVILLPFALLSAMPLANQWDHSLKRFTQAGVVLYGITVSFGLAFFITGIILNFVHEFT